MITKAEVRYEGTVVKLDKVERAMHLKEVRSYGSEGRKIVNGEKEVPARDDVIGSVIFKIELVRDM